MGGGGIEGAGAQGGVVITKFGPGVYVHEDPIHSRLRLLCVPPQQSPTPPRSCQPKHPSTHTHTHAPLQCLDDRLCILLATRRPPNRPPHFLNRFGNPSPLTPSRNTKLNSGFRTSSLLPLYVVTHSVSYSITSGGGKGWRAQSQ